MTGQGEVRLIYRQVQGSRAALLAHELDRRAWNSPVLNAAQAERTRAIVSRWP